MRSADTKTRLARLHLCRNDPVMRTIIDQVGPFTLTLQRDRFGVLVKSIISQQISVSAARSIRRRLEQLVAPALISPESISNVSSRRLRSIGLSKQKTSYILDLCRKTSDGAVELNQIGRLSDEKIIAKLTRVNGIGRWTAQMFLIFALGRLDVLPYDDLGVKVAMRNHYGLANLPDKSACQRIAANWRPFSTVASWYCWRILDLNKNNER